MKEIRSQDYEEFRDEVRVLERFSGSNKGHRHLIRLLMAFKHGEKYYLLFRWADGNLVDLWKKHRLSPASLSDTRWLIQQSLGIAHGLRKIHCHSSWDRTDFNGSAYYNGKNRGRHGDIKPENILCFENDEDTKHDLVISDFGLTRFHSPDSVSRATNAGCSQTYRAPEFDIGKKLSPKYDIWSLGCLYLEFLTWFLLGFQETRHNFVNSRHADDDRKDEGFKMDKFFNVTRNGHPGAIVKQSVQNVSLPGSINQLTQNPLRSDADRQ